MARREKTIKASQPVAAPERPRELEGDGITTPGMTADNRNALADGRSGNVLMAISNMASDFSCLTEEQFFFHLFAASAIDIGKDGAWLEAKIKEAFREHGVDRLLKEREEAYRAYENRPASQSKSSGNSSRNSSGNSPD